MTRDHERFGGWRRGEAAGIDNRVTGSGAGAVVQAGSIQQVSIAGPPPGRGQRPGQLPPDVRFFTGRAEELAKLDALLDDVTDAGRSSAVVISAIAGAGGMGKTSLAVHWAHRVRDRFPDGQLYVNLRGYDPSPPLSPARALDQFLRALGTTGEAIPQDADAMASLYRSLLADRRMLVVLDNAAAPEQVRPLLPNTPRCLVLVTSRGRLSGLVARDGARRITLDQLAPAEAVTLLREIIGPARADAELDALRDLARRCAGLPLALRIAAGRIADHPHLSLADLATDLAEEQNRLDVLATDDDETTAVRTVFSWSYRELDAETARTFRLLGLHPGPTISTPAAAALLAGTTTNTRRHLDTLTSMHLLTQIDRDRYQFHDLLRDYAAEQADLHESEPDQDFAVRRAAAWYLHTAYAARQLLNPLAREMPIDPPGADCHPLMFDSPSAALRWCDQEYSNLIAAARSAAQAGHHELAAQLPLAVGIFQEMRARWTDVYTLSMEGIANAQNLGNLRVEARLACNIGETLVEMSRFAEAIPHFHHALAIARNIRDRRDECLTLHHLGRALSGLRRLNEATDCCQRALTIYQEIHNQRGEGLMLSILGEILRKQQRFDDALDHHRRAVTLIERIGYRWGEARARHVMGLAYSDAHQFDDAIRQLRRSASISREFGARFHTAETLREVGDTLNKAGRADEAHDTWREALAMFEELNAPQADEIRTRLASRSQPRNDASDDRAAGPD